jgi:hypothetical protein
MRRLPVVICQVHGSPRLLSRQLRGAGHVPARVRCPASVIVTQTTLICRLPARMVPGSVVARPSRTRPASSSILKPCASRIASVQPRGLPASSLSAPALFGADAPLHAHRHAPIRLSRASAMLGKMRDIQPRPPIRPIIVDIRFRHSVFL